MLLRTALRTSSVSSSSIRSPRFPFSARMVSTRVDRPNGTPRRPRIIGFGYPSQCVDEWKDLERACDITYFFPRERGRAIEEVKELCEQHGPFDAGYTLWRTGMYAPYDQELMGPFIFPATADAPAGCGIWAQMGVGYDDVDVPFFSRSGCWVTNSPNAVTEGTADGALALMFAAMRSARKGENSVRAGMWRKGVPPAVDPNGKTLGVIGLGSIGKDLVRKVKPWNMKVLYYKRSRLSPEEEAELGVTYTPLDDLYANSDVISVNCPLTPETQNLLNDEAFAKMKTGVFVVNTARGAIIDEAALVRALDSDKVRGAGIDVYPVEPAVNSPLFERDDVTLQPHTGAYTEGTMVKGELAVFDNIWSYFKTGKPRTPVNHPDRAPAPPFPHLELPPDVDARLNGTQGVELDVNGRGVRESYLKGYDIMY